MSWGDWLRLRALELVVGGVALGSVLILIVLKFFGLYP
jgi:hypothetical protein